MGIHALSKTHRNIRLWGTMHILGWGGVRWGSGSSIRGKLWVCLVPCPASISVILFVAGTVRTEFNGGFSSVRNQGIPMCMTLRAHEKYTRIPAASSIRQGRVKGRWEGRV